MPELPEVETVKLALIPALQGRTVLSVFVGRKDLRWPLPENMAERLTGRQFTRLARRGKYVMICLLYTSPSPRDLSTSRMPSSA